MGMGSKGYRFSIIFSIIAVFLFGSLGVAEGAIVFVSEFGSFGTLEGELDNPLGIGTDSSGNIYIPDTDNYRVQKFDSSGNFLEMFGWGVATGATAFETCTSGCQKGISGTGDGQFAGPFDISVDSAGNIYVIDEPNDRVQKFNSAFVFQTKWGTTGSGDTNFFNPRRIAIDSSDNIFVVDRSNDRVIKFDTSGVFQGWLGKCELGVNCDIPNLRSNGFACTAATCTFPFSNGNLDGQFSDPVGIYADASSLYVTDSTNNRIQKI